MASTKQVNGFTLIEMVLALSIFSLILLIAYQTVVSSSQARLRVSNAIDQQSERRSAYRTLSNAVDSQASVSGDRYSIEFDLSTADSPWLEGADRLRLVIADDHSLWAYVDGQQPGSRLLREIDQAEFSYFNDGISQLNWNKASRPSAIELNWSEQGQLQRWRFSAR
ncbi:MAG: prepilin-type N-terminal cleavage/methylation domain-containing protein [Arenicella sp.]|nr:prepilin-type N-terminal cleavage/methylation domain-containing protein [Arenicella sp.]